MDHAFRAKRLAAMAQRDRDDLSLILKAHQEEKSKSKPAEMSMEDWRQCQLESYMGVLGAMSEERRGAASPY